MAESKDLIFDDAIFRNIEQSFMRDIKDHTIKIEENKSVDRRGIGYVQSKDSNTRNMNDIVKQSKFMKSLDKKDGSKSKRKLGDIDILERESLKESNEEDEEGGVLSLINKKPSSKSKLMKKSSRKKKKRKKNRGMLI